MLTVHPRALDAAGYIITIFKETVPPATECYSFRYKDDGRIPVHPANLGIIQQPNLTYPQYLNDNSVIVGVDSAIDLRRRRLAERSPDIKESDPVQAEYRMAQTSDLLFERSHFVIQNNTEPAEAQTDFQTFLNAISPYTTYEPPPAAPIVLENPAQDVVDSWIRQAEGALVFLDELMRVLDEHKSGNRRTNFHEMYFGRYASVLDALISAVVRNTPELIGE